MERVGADAFRNTFHYWLYVYANKTDLEFNSYGFLPKL